MGGLYSEEIYGKLLVRQAGVGEMLKGMKLLND